MLTIFQGEQRNGRVKLTSDRDCLAPDILHFRIRTFECEGDVLIAAMELASKGRKVCVDTETVFYEN